MLHQLNNLPDEELQELYDAIPVITLLIAGADGDIEGSELEQSEKITKIRGFSGGEIMQDFYDHIGKDYKERLTRWAKIVPKDNLSL